MPAPMAAERRPELSPRVRTLGVIGWCSFLAASVATMLCFAFLDPLALRECDVPPWWTTRLHVYGLGFFFFWLVGAIAAALAVLLGRTASGTGAP